MIVDWLLPYCLMKVFFEFGCLCGIIFMVKQEIICQPIDTNQISCFTLVVNGSADHTEKGGDKMIGLWPK